MSHRCPVCMNLIPHQDTVCSNCGYAEFRDYEKYLALDTIEEDAVPTQELLQRVRNRYVLREELEQEQEKNKALQEELGELQFAVKYEQRRNEDLLHEKNGILCPEIRAEAQ